MAPAGARRIWTWKESPGTFSVAMLSGTWTYSYDAAGEPAAASPFSMAAR
jgi:hypothetical protein